MDHIPLQEALRLLKEGNRRFAAGSSERPRQDAARRLLTSEEGQRPFAAVIACSDSRIPVELVFDSGIGDIFVIRVAGNYPGPAAIGSLEFAVTRLGVRLVVVLGHSQCGTITAAVNNEQLQGHLRDLKDRLRTVLLKTSVLSRNLPPEELIEAAAKANVRQTITDLAMTSPTINELVRKGTLALVGAFYDIRNGTVEWMDEG